MDVYALQTIDLTYTYPGGGRALNGVDFRSQPGEFVAVLGPNGSGKTTLFRHFSGALQPTSGRVLVQGREVSRQGDWLYRTVGFVFQDPNDQLFAATVGEDVAFGPRNLGLSGEVVADRVRRCLDRVGIPGYEGRPVGSLSFGQKRRVALAGVLAMEPAVLVLDEPTAGLDPLGASRMMNLLLQLNRQQGVTVVVATHDVDLLPSCVQRIYVLQAGRVVVSGPPAHVFSRAELLHRCELRPPRVAQALRLVGEELGQSLVNLPLTMDGLPPWADEREGLATDTTRGRARRGFTTGEAAAAAARAAGELLFLGRQPDAVELRSPLGDCLVVPVAQVHLVVGEDRAAVATVVKEGVGPDDLTHGAAICAQVRAVDTPGVVIQGGRGVGRAVRAGLAVRVGEPVINPLPRQMIADALAGLLPPGSGAKVTVSVPAGEEIASRTINALAGIAGGIAILGGSAMKKAVLLLGHGSRAIEANEAMYRVAESVRRLDGYPIVEVGFLSLNPPTLSEAVGSCVAQGAERVLVVPYFLHLGMHVQRDLPDMLDDLRGQHPGVEIVLGQHLGFHPKLVEVVADRIRESEPAEGGQK